MKFVDGEKPDYHKTTFWRTLVGTGNSHIHVVCGFEPHRISYQLNHAGNIQIEITQDAVRISMTPRSGPKAGEIQREEFVDACRSRPSVREAGCGAPEIRFHSEAGFKELRAAHRRLEILVRTLESG